MALALAACGKRGPTSVSALPPAPSAVAETTLATFHPRGPITVTPSGRVAIYANDYGEVLRWHLETAENGLAKIAPCVGVDPDRFARYPVLLLTGSTTCGTELMPGCAYWYGDGGHIAVLGSSWDFDPRHPEVSPAPTAEIARLWRHEFIHIALGFRDGDIDANHARPEWACQF